MTSRFIQQWPVIRLSEANGLGINLASVEGGAVSHTTSTFLHEACCTLLQAQAAIDLLLSFPYFLQVPLCSCLGQALINHDCAAKMAPAEELVDTLKGTVDKLEARVAELEARLKGPDFWRKWKWKRWHEVDFDRTSGCWYESRIHKMLISNLSS